MNKIPPITPNHKICIICEGLEDTKYIKRLISLNVWNDLYKFIPINAKSASNIPARYQNEYQNDSYELVLVFCDTDKAPFREYNIIKEKIDNYFGIDYCSTNLIIFANPCTMQIILFHFGEVLLKNQGKKTNSAIISELTGIENYDAHEDQIEAICNKIFRRTYQDMKCRISKINFDDTVSGSTNFISFLEKFESDNTSWIDEINKSLCVYD